MHYHSQNLSEHRDGTHGPMWRHGRAWWYFGDTWDNRWQPDPVVGVEWSLLGGWGMAIEVDVPELGGEHDIHLTWKIPGLALYINLEWRPLYNLKRRVKAFGRWGGDRSIGFSIHSGILWWTLWMSDGVWSSDDPKWRRGTVHLVDLALGKRKLTRTVLEERDVDIPLPEGTYRAHVKLEEFVFRRRRLPWDDRVVHADLDIVGDAPLVPGKGENSWDMGDDHMLGMGMPARTIPDAIGKYVAAVLETRERHGGAGWKPRAIA